jgi:hypothetical protein
MIVIWARRNVGIILLATGRTWNMLYVNTTGLRPRHLKKIPLVDHHKGRV